jgi:hypothetical protein
MAGVWLTAVTSEMSQWFVESTSIRRTLMEVASSIGARALLLDLEGQYEFVFPGGSRFVLDDESFIVSEEVYEVDIDLFLEAVIRLRGAADQSR